MIIVLDASAALEIALNNTESDRFAEIISNAKLVIAPDIYPSEVVNAFWKYAAYSDMDEDKFKSGIDYCIDLIEDFIPTKFLSREVFSEAINHQHPSYDIFYAVIARRNDAILVSKDKKLKKIAKIMGVKTVDDLT